MEGTSTCDATEDSDTTVLIEQQPSLSSSVDVTSASEDIPPRRTPERVASDVSQRHRGRRRQHNTTADFQRSLLEEQRLLREMFVAAHKEEMALRSKQIKIQERIFDVMAKFYNKGS